MVNQPAACNIARESDYGSSAEPLIGLVQGGAHRHWPDVMPS